MRHTLRVISNSHVMCIQTTNILNDRNDRFHLFYPPARWGPLDSNKGATSSLPSPSTFTFFLLLHLLLSASSFCQLAVTVGTNGPEPDRRMQLGTPGPVRVDLTYMPIKQTLWPYITQQFCGQMTRLYVGWASVRSKDKYIHFFK